MFTNNDVNYPIIIFALGNLFFVSLIQSLTYDNRYGMRIKIDINTPDKIMKM